MPIPKKPSAKPSAKPPSQATQAPTGWRSVVAGEAPISSRDLVEARQRAKDSQWTTLGGILSNTVGSVASNWLAATQQPLSNLLNLYPGTVSSPGQAFRSSSGKTLPEMIRRNSLGDAFSSLGYMMAREPVSPNAPERFLKGEAVPSSLSASQAQSNPLDPNVFGPRSQAIAINAREARMRQEAQKRARQEAADAVLAQQEQKIPAFERAVRSVEGVPFVGNLAGALWDSRGGLQSSAVDAGFSPEAGAAMEGLNPLSYTPADVSMAPFQIASRMKAGKSLSAPFRYEGVWPQGERRIFQANKPVVPKYTTPMAKLEEVKARRQAALAAQAIREDIAGEQKYMANPTPPDSAPWRQKVARFQDDWKKAISDEAQVRDFNEQWRKEAQQQIAADAVEAQRQKMADYWTQKVQQGAAESAQRAEQRGASQGAAAQRAAARKQQAFKSQWDAALAEQRATEQWAAERAAGRAEGAGFNPDPAGAVQGGWRSRLPQPTAPKMPPPLDGTIPSQPIGPQRGAVDALGNIAPDVPPPPPATLAQQVMQEGVAPPKPVLGWRAKVSSPSPDAPAVPSAAPAEPAVPVEAPRVPQNAVQEVPPAPPQPAVPPRAQEAPPPPVAPVAGAVEPAAPDYGRIDMPGVREPVAPEAPAVGTGNAAPAADIARREAIRQEARRILAQPTPGDQARWLREAVPPSMQREVLDAVEELRQEARAASAGDAAPPAAAPPPTSRRVQELSARWNSMSSKQRLQAMNILPAEERAALIAEVRAQNEAMQSRHAPGPRPKKNGDGYQVGFLGYTPQLGEEIKKTWDSAMRGTGDAVLRLVDAAKAGAGKLLSAGGGFSPQTRNVAAAAKGVVDRVFSRRLLTDNVKGADMLDDLVSQLRDLESASARRANDRTAGLRRASLDERFAANEALGDGSIRRQLRMTHPTLAKTVDELRSALDEATHKKLAAQFQVSETVWRSLTEAQQRELGNYLTLSREISPATGSPATTFDAFKAATLSKLKASGALRLQPDGTWKFTGNMLDVDTALDNLGRWAPRKYSAFEGGKEVFNPLAVIDENAARYGPAGKTPNPSMMLTDGERKYLQEDLGPKIQSAFATRDTSQIQHLLEREHLSPALREALGELTVDPGYRVALGLHTLERDVARSQAFEAIAMNPDWVIPLDGNPDAVRAAMEKWGVKRQPVSVPNDSSRYGILAGRQVHPEVADLLTLHFGEPQQKGVGATLRSWTNWWKANVTVLNPDSQVRQFIQNWVQGDLAGAGAVGHADNLRQTWGEVYNRQGALYEQARDAGLFSGTFHDAELTKELHEKILGLPTDGTSMDYLGRVVGALSAVKNGAGNVWELVDDWHRLAVYKHAIENGSTPMQAVKHVRDTLYDASKMSRFERFVTGRGVSSTLANPGKGAAALDLLSTVVQAPFGMASIFGARNAVRSLTGMRAGRWVPLSDPALALRASKYWMLPLMIQQAASAAMGGDDAADRPAFEQPVLDKVLPLSVRLPDFTARFLGQDGKPQYFSTKAFLPWGELAGTVYDTMQGETSMVRSLPGLGEHPFLQAMTAIATNEDPFTKKELWNSQMGAGEIVANAGGYLTRSLAPRLTPGVLGAIPAQAQRIADGNDPGMGSFLEDTVRYGGPLYQRLAAGAYNDAVGRDNVDGHIADYNMRDWSLPRAAAAALGFRTYQGDAERNAKLRDIERRALLKKAEADFQKLERQPGRSEAARAADASRFAATQRRIREGKPYRVDPWANPTLQRILLGP